MSYNISGTTCIVLDAHMYANDVVNLIAQEEYPEGCFLLEMEDAAHKAINDRKHCKGCNVSNEMDAAFCKRCGTKLTVASKDIVRIDMTPGEATALLMYLQCCGPDLTDLASGATAALIAGKDLRAALSRVPNGNGERT